ncbi:MAG: radical SAM protein [Clostridia bacterium]|nr:radical SAM protein [Clostridia bacterium]
MKKTMCITYVVGDSLYVNVTNRCSNRCDFCIRNNGDGAYGSESLWLIREPTKSEILASILSHDLGAYRELVFCGYGEPSFRLEEIAEISRRLKGKYPKVKIRINTNGQSDLILGCDSAPMYKGAFDTVSISLNSSTPEGYERICHPKDGSLAFGAILAFARRVKTFVPHTVFSVVDEFISVDELAECKRIAEECGVALRVREYIGPEEK